MAHIFVVVVTLLFSSFAFGNAIYYKCMIEGSASNGDSGTSIKGPHDFETHEISKVVLEQDGSTIRKLRNKELITSYFNAREDNQIISASIRNNAIVSSLTLDKRSGRLHEVLFKDSEVSNMFYSCTVIKQ